MVLKKVQDKIDVQPVIAILILNLVHKFVREIPGAIHHAAEVGSGGTFSTIGMSIIILTAIILILCRKRAGIYLGFLPASWIMIQWIFVHVIKGLPDQTGVWWYPIFPIALGFFYWFFAVKTLKQIDRTKGDKDE